MATRVKLGRSRGFTLLELMIVISMILILMSIALPIYNQSVVRARESVLRQDLFELRSLISQYTLDKQKAPQGLDDLVQAGYLKTVPKDPMTNEANWEVKQEDVLLSVDQQDPGIDDVHSASNATGTDGTAYSTW
jgi:general secretion pathway protein G